MSIHGKYDQELKVGSTTQKFILARDENDNPMYRWDYITPKHRDPLRYTYQSWLGGHGQHRLGVPDMYFEGQSIDTTQEGRVFLGPLIVEEDEDDVSDLDGATENFVWFPAISKLMCWTSTNIYRLDSNGWDLTATTVTGVTDLKVFGAILYAARGASTRYSYSSDGDSFTQTDLSDGYANKFLVAPNPAGTADNLWKFKTPNEVSVTSDGRTLSPGVEWTTPNYVGDTTTNITNIFLHGDRFLVGREDGLWYMDSDGGIHPLREDLKENRSTDNFKYVTKWSAGTYFSEIDGMGELTSRDAYESMGPLTKVGTGPLGDISKRGAIVGLAADKDYLYVAIDEGTNTIIYKGKEVRRNGILRWEWCPWIFLGTKTCKGIYTAQHSSTDRRLWFGYTNSTAYVNLSDNPTSDSAADFCASGSLKMSFDYGTEAEWDKLWQSAILEVTGGATGDNSRTVQIKYTSDVGSSTECIAAAATNGIFETNFGSEISTERVQFEIHLARTGTTTGTPEVSYFQAKGVEKPVEVKVHEAVYIIDGDPSNNAKTLRDLLNTARSTTTLLRFADLRFKDYTSGTAGTDFVYVVMEPGFPQLVDLPHTRGRVPMMGMKVRLREVSFT